MAFFVQFSIALRALWRNKSRAFLTMLGVIIGVSSVSLLIAIGDGLRLLVVEQFDAFGANNVFIAPGEIFGEGGGFGGQVTALANNPIQYSDVQDLSRLRDYVQAITVLTLTPATVSYRAVDLDRSVAGVNAAYESITNTVPESGTFFSTADNTKREHVAVLGHAIAQDLFGDVDPIGKSININNQSFDVVAVAIEKGGGFGGPAFDDYVYIPIETYFQTFNTRQIFRIIIRPKDEHALQSTMAAVENMLSKRLDDDEFSVIEQSQILDVIDTILSSLTAGLGGIAAISLVVGGIGIMNIMLVSVNERTREIGLRKALGATPNTILAQFVIEAVVISLTGGMIGVALAGIGAFGISNFIPATLTFSAIALAFGVSVVVGVVFGVYPARKAAQLSPIEALRYE